MNMVALIPARAGSKRCPGKNTREFFGYPLWCYTARAAFDSGVFRSVVLATDMDPLMVLDLPIRYRESVRVMRRDPVEDAQPDIAWVREALKLDTWESFAILRPTSPFRTAETIRRAYKQFTRSEVHSIRAVEPVKQHPGKMWQVVNGCIYPLIGTTWPAAGGEMAMQTRHDMPFHSQPTQALPKVFVQNSSLEMAWSYVVPAFGTISGRKVAPFYTEGYEGFAIDTEDDWAEAVRLVESGAVTLPRLSVDTVPTSASAQ